jgi:hypothetical protein
MSTATVWERVDEPVLRWVLANPPRLGQGGRWQFQRRDDSVPSELVEGLSDRAVHEALERLASHGLIDGNCQKTQAFAFWSRLRVSALGLVVLGEWPDLDRLSSAANIRQLLLHLASAAPPAEESALKRSAGLVVRMGGEAVRDTLGTLSAEATEEILP